MTFFANKKGNAVTDSATVIVVGFVFVLMCIIGYVIFGGIRTNLTPQLTAGTVAYDQIENNYDRYPKIFDSLIVFVFVALWIMGIIASLMIDSNPLFFGITMLLLVFVIISSIYIANFYDDITSQDTLSTAAAVFVKTNFIFNHLLQISILISLSIALVLYAKMKT